MVSVSDLLCEDGSPTAGVDPARPVSRTYSLSPAPVHADRGDLAAAGELGPHCRHGERQFRVLVRRSRQETPTSGLRVSVGVKRREIS